ncbi:MAG: GntR family transcriptional regulator [Deltaproteobacteria bacterium]|nr:GntR family transcriptional regulator [Deltaproteobacteria bacterium]
MPYQPIDQSNLSKQVAKALRRQILSGELKPDDKVVESEIARALGVSRAPVREAIVELDRDGLIVTVARKGAYVANFTEKDIEEIYTLRALLEVHAGWLASNVMNKDDVRSFESILDKMHHIDPAGTAELNVQFHEGICRIAGHKRLCISWKSLAAQTRMLSAMAAELRRNVTEIALEHEVLLRALVGRNEADIKENFQKHIMDSMNRLLGHFREVRIERDQAAIRAYARNGLADRSHI